MLPSPADGMPSAEAPHRPGRAWAAVEQAGMQPEYEKHPAVTTLHRLAEMEYGADLRAKAKLRWARTMGIAGTLLTVLALALAAVAGFGSLNDLVGPRTAAIIALASAVASAISAFLQTKTSGPALLAEADIWRNYADDVHDSVVTLVSGLPLAVDEFRSRADAALQESRTKAPSRAHQRRSDTSG